MNNHEINAALTALNEAIFTLEDEYMENGGEVTEETEAQEEYIEQLKALLEEEGIDSLGRWLKSKEDLIKTLKAERDSVNRQIKKTEDGIEYIKTQIFNVLTALGKDKVKGTFYSFAPSISRKTEVDKEILEEKYLAIVNNALEQILPPWVSFKLSASVKAVPGDMEELPSEFKVTETPTCKFVKPRAKKEE
jgi:chromosome segregation ATPase